MTQPARSAVAVSLFFVAGWAAAQPHNWPQWQGPTRDCLSNETGLLKSWPEGGPRQLWLFDDCGAGYAGPAVVDGRLFILGTRDGICCLLAIEADSGRELWHVALGPALENNWGSGPRSTPTVDEGLIYALGGKGVLICVHAADGREVWRDEMQQFGGREPQWGYSESVLIDGDLLVCTPGGPAGAIVALDKSTGELRWQAVELNDVAHYSSIVKGEFHGRPQYVQLLVSRLVGLAPEDGQLLWQVDWPGRVAVIPTPIIHDGKVFATSGYGAGCTLIEVGDDNEPIERYDERAMKLMKNHHGGVIRLGDYLYGHSDNVGWVCMEFATGKKIWSEKNALGKGAIGYADGRFYCLSEDDGEVVLIDASPEGWQEHGRFTLAPQTQIRSDRGKIWTHPVIVDGKLFLRDQDLLYCYDVKK